MYENFDTYLRQNLYFHQLKIQNQTDETLKRLANLFTAENLFKQIVYFGSYDRMRENLNRLLRIPKLGEKDIRGINFLNNTLLLI